MAKRQVDFISGFETPTAPVVGTPTLDGHLVTKGYADDTYTPRAHVYGKVSDLTALKAIAAADRFDEQLVWQAGVDAWYEFDASGVQTPDDDEVVQPTSGTGRWLKVASGGGGAVGSGSAIDAWKQKYEQEHYDIYTDSLSNSVGESFSNVKPTVTGVLLQDLAAIDTEAYIVWNRSVVRDVDVDFDSIINWFVQGDAGNLTTDATTFKTGTASLEWDKSVGGATNARIRYDHGSAGLSLAGKTEVYFWHHMPSITNFSNIEIRIDVDGTNYQTFTTTTDIEGNAITTGWNFIKFDVSSGGSASGTGWDSTKLFRYFHIGVNTSSAAQTYTDMYTDSLSFGIASPTKLVQKGSQFTIYDTSTVDNLQIDNASTLVQGLVTLVAATGEAYTAGEQAASASVKRVTLQTLGDNLGYMETGLSGEIADLQTSRISRVLPVALAGNDITSIFDVNTNCHFEVTAVNSSTEIEVDDPVDQSANLVSGKIIHVAAVYYNDEGKPQYVNRELDLTISSSSHSTGTTTITTGTNTGIQVGDVVILKHIDAELSCVALGADENFAALSSPTIDITSLGISIPHAQNVWGHWYLGGVNTSEATKNRLGVGSSLTINGTLNTTDSFLNGLLSSSGFTSPNAFFIPSAEALDVAADNERVAVMVWCHPSAFTGVTRGILNKKDAGSNGFGIYLKDTSNHIGLSADTLGYGELPFNPNNWNMFFTYIQSGQSSYNWLNGSKSASFTPTITANTANFGIGFFSASGSYAIGTKIAYTFVWRNPPDFSVGQLDQMYNQGRHALLGFKPGICYEYESTGQVGQLVTSKGSLSRVTDDAIVAFRKHGAIVTG